MTARAISNHGTDIHFMSSILCACINNEDSYCCPNICRQMKLVWEMFTLEKHIYCLYNVDMSLYELIVVCVESNFIFFQMFTSVRVFRLNTNLTNQGLNKIFGDLCENLLKVNTFVLFSEYIYQFFLSTIMYWYGPPKPHDLSVWISLL